MQERRNKRRLWMLVVLVVATVIAYWWVQPENRIRINQQVFQVPDLRSISKVELRSDTDTIVLAFNGTRWQVNGADADGNMINVLFATLQQARARRMVAHTNQDSIYRQLRKAGVEVRLYAGDELRKTFLAGGNAAHTQAFFADPATREVYVMAIPGYRVYVSGIFELGESGWWDKLVFGFNWAHFKKLTAEFPRKRSDNFTVSRSGAQFGVEGLTSTDTARLNTFLDQVSLLTVDQYVADQRLTDSLANATAAMHISVWDIGDRKYDLKLYTDRHASRIPGVIGDARSAYFSRRSIGPLLRPKSYFLKK